MNKKMLLQKIKKEFPKLHWRSAKHIVEGWDHYVLLLDGKYIFRFPRKKEYAKKLYNETQLLKFLSTKDLGVALPQYEFLAKDKSFAGYRMLPGKQMTPEVFKKMSGPSKNFIAKQLGLFLSKLHGTSLTTAAKFQARLPSNRKRFKELVASCQKFLKPRFSKKNYALVEGFLEEFSKQQKFPNKCFTHSDLHPWHLILNKNQTRLSGIIDFSDRSINDPAIDFGELWAYDKEFVAEVYKHYTGKKDKNFLLRSELYYKRIPLWIMVASFLKMGGKYNMGYEMFKKVYLHQKV